MPEAGGLEIIQKRCVAHSSRAQKAQDHGASRFGVWGGSASGFIEGCVLLVSSRGKAQDLSGFSLTKAQSP